MRSIDQMRSRPITVVAPVEVTGTPKTAWGRRFAAALATTLAVALGPGAVSAAADAVHPVTVVVTNPEPGKSRATTEAEVRAQFDGMARYWRDQSRGLVDFRLAKLEWAPDLADCDVADRGDTLDDAAQASGYTSGPQKHLLLFVADCDGPAGSGTLTSGITGTGRVYFERYDWKGFWSHELGHNLGFGHAGVLVCPGVAVDGALTADGGSCSGEQYADPYDTLGSSPKNQYKGYEDARMRGELESFQILGAR